MAGFFVDGFTDLSKMFDNLSDMPDSVTDEMLNVEADIIVKAQKQTASTMLKGPYYKGGVAASIKKSKIKKTSKSKSISIDFVGQQHGEDIATIAFINEYGKKNQPARPFIATANELSEANAIKAAEKVLNNYIGGI